jgi:hypothetical protein
MNYRKLKPKFVHTRNLSVEDAVCRQAKDEIGTDALKPEEDMIIRCKYGMNDPQFTVGELNAIRFEEQSARFLPRRSVVMESYAKAA